MFGFVGSVWELQESDLEHDYDDDPKEWTRKLYVDVVFGSKVKDFIFMFLCAHVGICKWRLIFSI